MKTWARGYAGWHVQVVLVMGAELVRRCVIVFVCCLWVLSTIGMLQHVQDVVRDVLVCLKRGKAVGSGYIKQGLSSYIHIMHLC